MVIEWTKGINFMGKNNYFEFKQFRIIQERSAMKVGMDGVLLGAWLNPDHCKRILDVGTGTGLLALMAAQQVKAIVDAVEIDQDACEEALFNFSNSPWAGRLNGFHIPFQDFKPAYKYDHIISNPPFFENSLKPDDEKRLKARHSESLGLNELLDKAASLLEDDGRISLIIPAEKDDQLQKRADETGLFIRRKCFVYPFRSGKPNRILLELAAGACELVTDKITIRDEGTNSYSEAYRKLTADFYRSL